MFFSFGFFELDIQLYESVFEFDFDINYFWLFLSVNEGKIFFWFFEELIIILLFEVMIQEDNFVLMCLNEIFFFGVFLEGE